MARGPAAPSCPAAWFLTGQGPVSVQGLGVGDPRPKGSVEGPTTSQSPAQQSRAAGEDWGGLLAGRVKVKAVQRGGGRGQSTAQEGPRQHPGQGHRHKFLNKTKPNPKEHGQVDFDPL